MATKKAVKRGNKTRRDLIIDAGIRLLARTPFTEMTIAGVAREADCGHSLVYHYFKNINEIYDQGINTVASVFKKLFKTIDTKTISPDLLLIGLVTNLVDNLKQEPMSAYYLSLLSFNHAGVPYSEKLNKVKKEWFNLILDIIQSGQRANHLITTMDAEAILHSLQLLFQGLVSAQMFNTTAQSVSFQASEIYLPFLKGAHNV